jgi:hypothetical protein
MEKVLDFFNIDENMFLSIKKDITSFVKSYFDGTMDSEARLLFSYLEGIDNNCEEYLQFGADKCAVDNFFDFCKDLNINTEQNLSRIVNEKSKFNDCVKRFHFYSRDKKLTFTCSTVGNYMHYFGITGEASEILRAFEIFCKRAKYDDVSFGNRDFI